MSLLWIEGFEQYGTSNGSDMDGLEEKYPDSIFDATRTEIADGRITGKSLVHVPTSSSTLLFLTTPNLGNMATVICGFGLKATGTLQANRFFSIIENDTTTEGINLRFSSGGFIQIYRTNSLIATTAEAVFAQGIWHHIEVKVTVHNTAGAYEVKVNGTTVLSDTNVNTRGGTTNNYANRVQLISAAGGVGPTRSFDDWYVCDATGDTNNNFLGDNVVMTIFPNNSGDSTDFTPADGDNYANVDENPLDGDSSYVESATPGHLDLYNFSNLTLENIKGVQINAVCKKTDSTDFDINLPAKSGSTVDSGSAQTVSHTSYLNKHRILEVDPDTEEAWTDSGINSAQFGIEVD